MKLLISLTLFLFLSVSQKEPTLVQVRDIFERASPEKESCKKLLNMLEPYNEHNNPTFYGYKAVGTMLMAKHTFNPFKKLSYFKKGRGMLDDAVSADPNNAELRFLRFVSQTEAPAFLNYRGAVEDDKDFLIRSLPQLNDPRMAKEIGKFLSSSDFVTAEEKAKIKSLDVYRE